MSLLLATFAVLKKDFLLEYRTRFGINIVLLFVLMSVSLVIFSFAGETLESTLLGTLLWNTIFFSAMASMHRGFVSEAEQSTILFLKLTAPATAILLGKLIYNIVLALAINLLVAVLYFLMLDFWVENPMVFLLTLLLGSLASAITLTLISAIVAGTAARSGLFAVLAFPPILPAIWLVVRATKSAALPESTFSDAVAELQLLLAYSVVMLTLSIMLFEYVWEE